ncbi:MAG: hypothetical protein ABL921_00450 [Pirellula sp.]
MFITLVFVWIAFVAIIVLAANQWKHTDNFKAKWPAITDEEFVAKCTPGTNPRTALRVRRIISEQLGVPYAHIHPEQRFVDDLNCC